MTDDEPLSLFPEHARPKRIIQLPLPPPPDRLAAYLILDALWQRIQPDVGKRLTRTQWKTRNTRIALALVHEGVSLNETLHWHRIVSERYGKTVQHLMIVRDYMLQNKPKPRATDYVQDEDLSDLVPLA